MNAVDSLDNIDEVNKLFKVGNVSKEIAEEALGSTHFADKLNDTVEGAAEGAEAMSNLAKATDGLKDGADAVDDLGNAFKGLGVQIGSALKALAMNPMTYLVGAAIGTGFLINNYIKAFDKAKEKSLQAQGEYSSTASEIQSINSELETSNARIEEIQSKGTITLTEQAELEKLQAQNVELERQLGLKESLASKQSKEARDSAMEALSYKRTEDMTQEVVGGADKLGNAVMTYGKTDLITATENELKELQKLKKNREKLLKEKTNTGEKKRKKEIESELDVLENDIKRFEESVTTNMQNISDLRNSFIDTSTGEMLKGLSSKETEYYTQMTNLLSDFNNIDLSPVEQKFKKIDSYFNDGTGNKSFLVDQLKEMASQSQLTEEDIKRMGIAIEGVDASEIAKYFNDMAKSANEAANATTKFGTLGEYKQALETANPGQDYLDIVEGLEKTKELYEQGLVGTDEFKSFSKMLSPSSATDEKNFIDNYNRLGKYFKSDDASGVNAFLTDLSKKTDSAGKSFASLDKKTGQWKINIKDTSEAAKQLGIGIVPFESMLKRLQDYNFDIDFHSAVEDFESVKTSLGGFDSVLERMQDGDRKDALKKQVDGWKSQLASWEADLSTLDTDIAMKIKLEYSLERMQDGDRKDALKKQVDGWKSQLASWEADLSTLDTDIAMKIKLEYSLAEIQAQIDEFKSKIDWGSANSENYANLLSGNEKYINTAKNNLGLNKEGVKVPVEFTTNESKIEELKQKLAKTTDEKAKVKIQAEIDNIQEIQKNLLDAFSDAHPEINADSSIEEISNALNSFFKSNEAKKILLELDTSKAEQQLDGILNNDGKVITMNVDASTEQIQKQIDSLKQGQTIVFDADVGGVRTTISGIKNEDGTMSYYAQVGDVIKKINAVKNPDGTITYVPNTTEVDAETLKKDGGTRTVLYQANTFGLPTYFNPITRTVKYKYQEETSTERFNRTGSALPIGKFNGTAHANGTLLNKRKGNAFASGNWGAKKTEKALVGELGQELLVRGSHFETIGDNGAEFANIRKGDVIFNH